MALALRHLIVFCFVNRQGEKKEHLLVLAMNLQSNLFVTLFQDSGGYYQCVSYDTRDVCELNYWACLCRPCFAIYGDEAP
jgi:hypothetical protein